MADSQVLEIVVIAAIAIVVLFRLYSVLGRRTGNEPAPGDPGLSERLPERLAERRSEPAVYSADTFAPSVPQTAVRPTDPVLSGLFDVSLADRNFDKEKFLSGARTAYEMIEGAYATGDRANLRALLSPSVFAAFDAALATRETDGRTLSFTFIGFKDTKIVAAELKNTLAQISVRFDAEFISALRDRAGAVVEGDDKDVQHVCDVWTFERDTRARNPNWIVVATAGADL